MSNYTLTYGLIVVGIIAIIGCFTPSLKKMMSFGATADCQSTTCISGGLSITSGLLQSNGTLQVGPLGTSMSQLLAGTCSLIATSYTVAATTTVPMDCAIPNTVSTDIAFAQFASSTATTFGGWSVRGASASTTAGFITVSVVNGTGASGTIPASIASTTKYIILR